MKVGIDLYLVFISNYRRKILILLSVLVLWGFMFLLSSYIIYNHLILKVTIENQLTLSYPYSLRVNNIYVNELTKNTSIETNLAFTKSISKSFSYFNSIKGKFSFNYPSILTLSEKDFDGSDILYHIDLQNKSNSSHGFVQLWNMPYSLKDFLDRSKSTARQNYKDFESKSITVNNIPGYCWDYTVSGNNQINYKALEVFLKKNNRMYRISYFVPEKLWDKSQADLFWSIVNSLKTY